MKNTHNHILVSAKIALTAMALLLGVTFAYSYVAAVPPPPLNNAPMPVNVGLTDQVKAGGLAVNRFSAMSASIKSLSVRATDGTASQITVGDPIAGFIPATRGSILVRGTPSGGGSIVVERGGFSGGSIAVDGDISAGVIIAPTLCLSKGNCLSQNTVSKKAQIFLPIGTTQWVKPAEVSAFSVTCVGGGGSGDNMPLSTTAGYPGGVASYQDVVDNSLIAQTYPVSIGAAGYDGNCGWSTGVSGGASTFSPAPGVNMKPLIAPGGAGSGRPYDGSVAPSSFVIPGYGDGGSGYPYANACGSTYGAGNGMCVITYDVLQ